MNKTIQRVLFFFVFSALVAMAQPNVPVPPPYPGEAVYFNPLEVPPWKSSASQLPKAATNLNTTPSWDYEGTAMSVDTNVPAFLQLDVFQNGKTNVTLDSGSLEIWCQANWTSVADGGAGPGTWATLWDIGSYTSDASVGAWLLTIDPSGSNLVWVAQAGGSNQMLSTGIDFDEGDWHEIVTTWSTTNVSLYVDGELMTNSGSILYQPSSVECSNDGFCIGSISATGTNAGTQQFQGQLQWLASYAEPLSANEIAARFLEMADYIGNFGYNAPGAGGFHADDTPTPPGGGTNSGSGGGPEYTPFIPPAPISATNYAAYNELYLTITNDTTNAYVSVCNTLSNLTYLVLTNYNLSQTNWGVWQTFVATNSITPVPLAALSSNAPFFVRAALVWSTCTNYSPALPDWWTQEYFNSTACVDPNANPSGDGIDNWDKYILGLNPGISYVSQILFNPPGGNYVNTPAVTIFSLGGSSIKYTTNGSMPSATNGIAIGSGVLITNLPGSNFILKAWESGLTNAPAIASYAIIPATPTFSLPSGVYGTGAELQIECATTNAIVYYTTNGIDPTTNSLLASTNLINLTTNVTVKAAAWLGTNASPIAEVDFTIEGAAVNDNFTNALVLSGSAGQFSGTTLASTVESFELDNYGLFLDANYLYNSVWYKWTAPSNGTVFLDYSKCNPSFYSIAISVYCFPSNIVSDPSNLVAAAESSDGDGTSDTFVATNGTSYYFSISDLNVTGPFDISWEYVGLTDPPIFSPGAGTYLTSESVTLSDPDASAVIRYTLDGSSPTTNSTALMSGSTVIIDTNETLKAAAWRAGLEESAVTAASYAINPGSTNPTLTAGAPLISPTNQDFASSLTITFTCTNAGGLIYYTLDDSMPSTASASVSSNGTVTISNSAIVNAVTWVTNMNLSSMATGQFAQDGADTADDGIPDTGKLAIGVDILVPEAGNVNPNPFAHGLNNLQVYENQSVLIADNYSTENDGIPDWWLVLNGYSATTSANALGANGQTLLASFVGGLNPNNQNSQPGQTQPIDFHIVHGPTNGLILVLDAVRPNMAEYTLTCINTDQGLPSQIAKFKSNQSLDSPSNGLGRYFQITNGLPPGYWYFTLQGNNGADLSSQMSSNALTVFPESLNFDQGDLGNPSAYNEKYSYFLWSRFFGSPIPVVGYTDKNALKEPLLAQELKAGNNDAFLGSFFEGSFGASPYGPTIYNDQVPTSVTTETAWGTLTFTFDGFGNYYASDYASYFTSLCETPDYPSGCLNEYPLIGYDPGELSTLWLQEDASENWYFYMPQDSDGAAYRFNPAGLEYLSVTYRIGDALPVTIYPGQSNLISAIAGTTFEAAIETETPTFQGSNYCFDGRDYENQTEVGGWDAVRSSPPSAPPTYADGWEINDYSEENYQIPIPVSVTNPIIIAQVGKPVNLQGWEQVYAIRPGGEPITNQAYWIDQDFDRAYLCDPVTGDVPRTNVLNLNGKYKIDTNAAITTGILAVTLDYTNVGWDDRYQDDSNFSQRGADFTPTQPGKIIVTTAPDSNGNYGEVTIYAIDIQVDANHDGVMDNRDLTSVNNPMQFWANNNYDRTPYDADDSAFYDDDVATNDPTWSPSPGTPGVSTPDWNYQAADGTQIISNLRDLQDYFRLWIPGLSNMVANLPTNYTVTLQWRNNTGAAVRIFKAAETNGGTNYQFNQSVGTLQLLWDSYPCYGFVSPSQTISLDQAFASTTVPKPSDYFIFCGSAVGNDELVCQVRNPYGGVVGEASVFLNIKDIKQMYERWSVGEYPSLPSNTATNCGDDGSPSFQYPYDPSIDSATPYILFVHGWNMQTWEKDRFAESAFKRLYWQGYQGRFGVFRWPTENGFTGTLIQFATTPSEKDNYDRSEYTAWQSATGLLNQLAFLNNRYPGQTYMLAHSMGNIVAGEALRLAGTTNVVNTYVASQAAISAHTYDPTITNYSFSDSPWILIANTPNIYGNWFATNNGRGAGEIISFYNVNDYALQRSAWQLNQLLKPDQFVLENGTHWDYSYNGLTNDPAPWNHFEKAVSLGFTVIDFDIVNVLTNRYEVMGLAAESYTTALGATPNVQNIRRNVDLSQLWPSDSVHPTHPFDEHFYHSAQFRGDYWQQQNYWSELLGADAFNLKP